MATKAIGSVTRSHGRILVFWENLGNADQGAPFEPPVGYDLQSMQFTGTIGGATLSAEGSNDESTYAALKSETAIGHVVPTAQALSYRPATSGGTGTDVDVYALFQTRS